MPNLMEVFTNEIRKNLQAVVSKISGVFDPSIKPLKKRTTLFTVFMKKQIKELKITHPHMTNNDWMKEISVRYKNLTE